MDRLIKQCGLYDPANEHDSCGVGFVVQINGEKSHRIVEEGLQILRNLAHRGALGGDLKTGDGAGMTLQLPHKFLKKTIEFILPQEGTYGVGMFFLPQCEKEAERARHVANGVIQREGCRVYGWRPVPVDPDSLGDMARDAMPSIWQALNESCISSENALKMKRPKSDGQSKNFISHLFPPALSFTKECLLRLSSQIFIMTSRIPTF